MTTEDSCMAIDSSNPSFDQGLDGSPDYYTAGRIANCCLNTSLIYLL